VLCDARLAPRWPSSSLSAIMNRRPPMTPAPKQVHAITRQSASSTPCLFTGMTRTGEIGPAIGASREGQLLSDIASRNLGRRGGRGPWQPRDARSRSIGTLPVSAAVTAHPVYYFAPASGQTSVVHIVFEGAPLADINVVTGQ